MTLKMARESVCECVCPAACWRLPRIGPPPCARHPGTGFGFPPPRTEGLNISENEKINDRLEDVRKVDRKEGQTNSEDGKTKRKEGKTRLGKGKGNGGRENRKQEGVRKEGKAMEEVRRKWRGRKERKRGQRKRLEERK